MSDSESEGGGGAPQQLPRNKDPDRGTVPRVSTTPSPGVLEEGKEIPRELAQTEIPHPQGAPGDRP